MPISSRIFLVFIFSFSVVSGCLAGTYYVDDDGAASWANCEDAAGTPGPKSGASACALSNATDNATAGDLVYIRGGTYTYSAASSKAIAPSNNGTSESTITFRAYTGETPLFVNANTGSTANIMAVHLNNNSYIKIDGLSFQDFYRWAYIQNSSHHNEITNCKFFNSAETNSVNIYITGLVSGTDYSGDSTHNWIHDNEIHTSGNTGCGEGSDLIKIGSASTGDKDSNYNTIENNTVYHAGHTLTEDYGKYNVWRNNVFHNEGWKTDVGTLSGGRHEVSISIANPAVVTKSGHGYKAGNVVRFATTGALPTGLTAGTLYYVAVAGFDVDSFQLTTTVGGTGDSIVTTGSQSGTHTSSCSYCPDSEGNNPGDAKYGHRCMSFTGYETDVNYRYNLVEGNRVGYASVNPNNNGADAITLGSPGNIVRYNFLFGSDGPGINLKRYSENTGFSGANNRIFNNTIYLNGRYTGICTEEAFYACTVSGVPRYAIYQYGDSSAGNVIKNNVFYQNQADYRSSSGNKADQIWANNLCDSTDADLGCTALTTSPFQGTPDMSDMTSTTEPTLALSSTSAALDGNTTLTYANGATIGDSNATLHVDDALYFQDGTWGSSLSNIQADWIAIGTVTNVVQISSIDYQTKTITLASPMTWADDAPIWLYKKSDGEVVLYGSAPDYGAHEYQDTSPTTSTSHASGSFNLR